MKLLLNLILSLLMFQVDFSTAQGAAWTKEETEIIATKILWKKRINSQAQGSQELVTANLLRLGFHDCMPYVNPEGQLVNGCDGCLHPMGMNVDLMEKYEDARNAPNNLTFFTNNNGLTATADILEEG